MTAMEQASINETLVRRGLRMAQQGERGVQVHVEFWSREELRLVGVVVLARAVTR